MGVLMNQHKITRNQAFDLLRVASQHTNRKLARIAVEVGDTGALDLPQQASAQRGGSAWGASTRVAVIAASVLPAGGP